MQTTRTPHTLHSLIHSPAMRPLLLLAVTALLVALCGPLAVPVDAGEFSAGVAQTVQQRHLVKDELSAAELLEHHADYSQAIAAKRQFDAGTFTLGYLTPWNAHGYDVAKKVTRGRTAQRAEQMGLSEAAVRGGWRMLTGCSSLCLCVCPVRPQVHSHLPRLVSNQDDDAANSSHRRF